MNRLGDGGRMVRKVVDHGHAVLDAPDLHPALDARKGRERLERLFGRDADAARRSNGCKCIELVVAAGHAELQTAEAPALKRRLAVIGKRPTGLRVKALESAPAALCEHAVKRLAAAVRHDETFRGHDAHEMMELLLDGGQIFKNVRVVVFKIVEDRRSGTIVHELAPLVEEGRVVFVGLDDEGRHRGDSAERRGARAPLRHAADQEAGLESRLLKDPGEHRRGGRLAVRARDRKHVAARKHMLAEPGGTGRIGKPPVENRLEKRIAAGDGVADHEDVGPDGIKLRDVIALHDLDPRIAERVAHGWVDVCVAPGHLVAGLARELGDAAHERAADAENMNVHVLVPQTRMEAEGASFYRAEDPRPEGRRTIIGSSSMTPHAPSFRRHPCNPTTSRAPKNPQPPLRRPS